MTRKTLILGFAIGIFGSFLTGCGSESESPTSQLQDDVGPVVGRPPRNGPATTTITVYSEAGLWGDSYTLNVTPTTEKETSTFVPPRTIASRSLARRISSARIVCGNRESSVFFLDRGVSNTNPDWSGRVHMVECSPGQTKTVNFHQVQINNAHMGDRIVSFQTYVHALNRSGLEFTRIFSSQWTTRLREMLPSQARQSGDPQMTFLHKRGFKIRQKLKVDGGALCREGTAYMEYSLSFYVNAGFPGMPSDRGVPVWQVVSHSSNVDGGWWCHGEYEERLATAVANGRGAIVNALNGVNFGPQQTYYLSPFYNVDKFYFNWGR